MSKAILVLNEMPDSCYACPLYDFVYQTPCCKALNKTFKPHDDFDIISMRQNWCPLKTQPEKEYNGYNGEWSNGWQVGWNTCVHKIFDD